MSFLITRAHVTVSVANEVQEICIFVRSRARGELRRRDTNLTEERTGLFNSLSRVSRLALESAGDIFIRRVPLPSRRKGATERTEFTPTVKSEKVIFREPGGWR